MDIVDCVYSVSLQDINCDINCDNRRPINEGVLRRLVAQLDLKKREERLYYARMVLAKSCILRSAEYTINEYAKGVQRCCSGAISASSRVILS